MEIITSKLDKSINFVEQQLTGFIESRYVRRRDDYFIAYLSSQTGCNRGCLMCHLTATKQTMFSNCDMTEFVSQLETVFSHYEKDISAKTVHINFMARGESLANPTITETGTELLLRLGNMVRERGLQVKFNISTIMPITFKKSLVDSFPLITPTIYYSIYSIDKRFRNKWLPAAMPVYRALELLADYQQVSKKIIKFHCAFIKGENDLDRDIDLMMRMISSFDIQGQFNIVRYNPFSEEQGEESPNVEGIRDMINHYMPCKIIPRVGDNENKASCGMFVEKKK